MFGKSQEELGWVQRGSRPRRTQRVCRIWQYSAPSAPVYSGPSSIFLRQQTRIALSNLWPNLARRLAVPWFSWKALPRAWLASCSQVAQRHQRNEKVVSAAILASAIITIQLSRDGLVDAKAQLLQPAVSERASSLQSGTVCKILARIAGRAWAHDPKRTNNEGQQALLGWSQ